MTMLMIFIIYLFINTYNLKHNIKEHNKKPGLIFYQSEFVFKYYFLEFALGPVSYLYFEGFTFLKSGFL